MIKKKLVNTIKGWFEVTTNGTNEKKNSVCNQLGNKNPSFSLMENNFSFQLCKIDIPQAIFMNEKIEQKLHQGIKRREAYMSPQTIYLII